MASPESFKAVDARAIIARIARVHLAIGKRPPRKAGDEPDAVPVESPRPRPLAGGAAAELEFDD